ncbi:TPA: phospholipase D-like domain-containing protein [Photobacterium damselae]
METKAYFENIEEKIIHQLNSAKKSVKICVAWINGATFIPVLEKLSSNNISVDVVYNNDSTNVRSGIAKASRINLYPINTRLSSSLMHNKFCIIDDEVLITGSYNWSRGARNSFENIIIIKNDFKLIKSFLHEFHDLIAFYKAFSANKVKKCKCRSNLYTLGVLGHESGNYNDSIVDIWSVCVKNQHVKFISEEFEQYLHTQLGLVDAPIWDVEDEYDKSSMLSEFNQEMSQIKAVQNYFDNWRGTKVHAVGRVVMINHNEHIEWGEEPEYIVKVIWKDMYYRKIIPDILYDDIWGGVNDIITKSV